MEVLMGTSSINGPFSMAMLNNQMVYIYMYCGFAANGAPPNSFILYFSIILTYSVLSHFQRHQKMGVSKISLISLVNTSYGLYFHEKPTLLRDLEIRGCRVA